MRIRKIITFAAGFGVARGLLFASPIVLANLLPLERYGQFELVQSYSAIGALLVGLGLPATVPLIRLREEIDGRWDSLLFLMMFLSGACLISAGIAALFVQNLFSLLFLVPVTIAILMMQGLWSTFLKCDARSTAAVFLETGFWTVAVVGTVFVIILRVGFFEVVIPIVLLGYAGLLMWVTVARFSRDREGPITPRDLSQNVSLGLPLMFSNALTVILISSGRIVIGQSAGEDILGVYGVLYRSTILPLVCHQVITIALFRQLFSWSDDKIRSRTPIVVVSVAVMALFFWLFEPAFGWILGQRFDQIFKVYRLEGLILLVQTILWSAIALHDVLFSRFQIAKHVAKVNAPFLLLGMGGVFVWSYRMAGEMSAHHFLMKFILIHLCLMIGYFILQCIVSWKMGLRFVRLWSAVFLSTVVVSFLMFTWELR